MRFDTPKQDTLVVTYNDEKTTPAKIMEALKKGGMSLKGQPINLN